MSVTGVPTEEREQYLAAVDRLAKSQVLHGSESLCKLLRYLAEHTLRNPGVPVKEYQIATEVFGRPADFDPHVDSAIRVQAGRLRVKLTEYYASEGAGESLVVELPKGTYSLAFHHRPISPKTAVTDASSADRRSSAQHTLRNWATSVVVLSILLAAAVAGAVAIWGSRTRDAVSAGTMSQSAPVVFRTFWRGFLSGPADPWVVFSNAAFVGRPETGMRYLIPGQDQHGRIMDHYTGVGEVLAVHELDHVFNLLHRDIRVKRGSLFSLDDVRHNDLIFVGSPEENLTLRDITTMRQFVFQRLTSGPRKGDLAVVNLHPRGEEPPYFLASPASNELTEDYAVIALSRGLNPDDSVVILAGTTTIGTEAAVEYVCRENSLQQLLSRMSIRPLGTVKPFEAVLQVKVARGVPVESNLVALRNETQ